MHIWLHTVLTKLSISGFHIHSSSLVIAPLLLYNLVISRTINQLLYQGMFVWRNFKEDIKLRREKWRESSISGCLIGTGREKKWWWIHMFSPHLG